MNESANPYEADQEIVDGAPESFGLNSSTFFAYLMTVVVIATLLASLSMIPPNYPGSLIVHPTVVGSEIVLLLITLLIVWWRLGKRMTLRAAMLGSHLVSLLGWGIVCGGLAMFMDGADRIDHFITFATISACFATFTTWLGWRKKVAPRHQQD